MSVETQSMKNKNTVYGRALFTPVEDIDDDAFMRIQNSSYVSVSHRLAEHFLKTFIDPTDYGMAVVKKYPWRYKHDYLSVLMSLKSPFWYFADEGDRVRIAISGNVLEFVARRVMTLEDLNLELRPHGLVAEFDAGQDSAHVRVRRVAEPRHYHASGRAQYGELSLCLPEEVFTSRLRSIIESFGVPSSTSGDLVFNASLFNTWGANISPLAKRIAVVSGDEVELCVECGSVTVFAGTVALEGDAHSTKIPSSVFKHRAIPNGSHLDVTMARC